MQETLSLIYVDELHTSVCEQILLAQKHYQGPADAHWTPPPPIKIGDQVYVKSEHIQTTQPSKKLAEKYLGPLEVIDRPTQQTVLHVMASATSLKHSPSLPCLPTQAQFRIGLLEPPPPPISVNSELKYKIAEVLDSKINNHRRSCKLLYLVHWLGYEGTDEETS